MASSLQQKIGREKDMKVLFGSTSEVFERLEEQEEMVYVEFGAWAEGEGLGLKGRDLVIF